MSKDWSIRKRRPVRRKNIAPLLKELEKALKIDLSVDGAFLEMAEYGPWKMVFVDKLLPKLRREGHFFRLSFILTILSFSIN